VLGHDTGDFAGYRTLRKHWNDQLKLKGPEHAWLTIAVYKTIGWKALCGLAFVVFIELFFALVLMVVALDWFLSYLEMLADVYGAEPNATVDYLTPSIIVIVNLFGVPFVFRAASITVALMDGWYCNICSAALGAMVFEKALRLPLGDHMPVGEDEVTGNGNPLSVEKAEANSKPNVVQLLNVDIIDMWTTLLKTILQTAFSPVIALVLFAMLISKLRLAGIVGFLYIVPCTICTTSVQFLMMTYWKRYQDYQDVRLKCLTEVVLNIRTIKSLAWESLSFQRLNDARLAELSSSQKTVITGGVTMALLHSMPWFAMLIALSVTLKMQGEVRASQIILVQRLMMSLLVAIGIMMIGLRKISQAPNSFKRIRTYLAQAEAPEDPFRPISERANGDAPLAVRAKGSFTYIAGTPPSIRDLDVKVPKGALVGVIGEVASGKSTLLHTLIGELFPVGGAFVEGPKGEGRIAFCAQVPWVFEGTLKENVVLQGAFDPERYQKALFSAAMLPDLKILPGGDMVTIGSNGIRLSGGQRARVALARAAYKVSADVVLIDDPFASVDIPTGEHLLNELLLGDLMRGRTRIVVTQPSIRLRKFDQVILVKDGAVVRSGTPAEVMESPEYMSLLATESEAHKVVLDPALELPDAGASKVQDRSMPEPTTANTLRDAEAQEYVSWDSVKWWMRAAGWGNLIFFFVMVIAQRMMTLKANLCLAVWVDAKTASTNVDDQHYMVMTAMYVCLFFICVCFVSYGSSRVSMSASTIMHSTVVYAILRAPIDRFFDKTPVGRLINRLSYDMRQVDDYIPMAGVAIVTFVLGVIVTQGFVLSAMPSEVVIAALPFYVAILLFMYLYRGTSVPLVFHTKFALSVLQDMQAMALNTAVSVRANGMFDNFIHRYNEQCAVIIRCQYLCSYVCRAWVQARVFLCLCLLTCLFALGGLYSRMPMGTLATCITLLFEQMVEFETISVVFTSFLNILNALQRLTNYFRIPQEGAPELPGDPVIRLRAQVDRAKAPHFEIRRVPEAEVCSAPGAARKAKGGKGGMALVVYHHGTPVLKASEDNMYLEVFDGASLAELFPDCAALKSAQAQYSIVAVNNTTKDAAAMAEELSNPPATLWFDLWHSGYTAGMRIVLDGVTAGYGRDPNVLNDVHISIPERCKVGFAGQTGCGKSTTLLCILRVLELRGGKITIGGFDISTLGLNTLRTMVGLVPQDPTVFQGTWRYNIDPFGEFPDGRIWEALHSVQLLPYIRTLPNGIETEITRDGGNISFGQRQLLSLARMVIRQPPVLLLDECTSSLDPSTQQVVQNTLLNEFPLSSIIAIAHRVETILDFDRIVVFSKGTVAEHGTVKEVMAIPHGIFRRMVEGAQGIKRACSE